MEKEDNLARLGGKLVGRYLKEPIADGNAFYKIVKENKASVRVEKITGIGDDWSILRWEATLSVPKSEAIENLRFRDQSKIFFEKQLKAHEKLLKKNPPPIEERVKVQEVKEDNLDLVSRLGKELYIKEVLRVVESVYDSSTNVNKEEIIIELNRIIKGYICHHDITSFKVVDTEKEEVTTKDLAAALGGTKDDKARVYKVGDTFTLTHEFLQKAEKSIRSGSSIEYYRKKFLGMKGSFYAQRLNRESGHMCIRWESGDKSNCEFLREAGLKIEEPVFENLKIADTPDEDLNSEELLYKHIVNRHGTDAGEWLDKITQMMRELHLVTYKP
jgi:hypothetical protein